MSTRENMIQVLLHNLAPWGLGYLISAETRDAVVDLLRAEPVGEPTTRKDSLWHLELAAMVLRGDVPNESVTVRDLANDLDQLRAKLMEPVEEPVSETLYAMRCGYCGAYEGTVDPSEVCRDSGADDLHHHFAVTEVYQGPLYTRPSAPTEGGEPGWKPNILAGAVDAIGEPLDELPASPCVVCGEPVPSLHGQLFLVAHAGCEVALRKRLAPTPEQDVDGLEKIDRLAAMIANHSTDDVASSAARDIGYAVAALRARQQGGGA